MNPNPGKEIMQSNQDSMNHSPNNNIQRPFKIQKIQTYPMNSILHYAESHNPDGIGTSKGPSVDFSSPGEVVIQRAINSVLSYEGAHAAELDLPSIGQAPPRTKGIRLPAIVKWVKPDQEVIKLNSDVNLSLADFWGIGVVARNNEGLAMASGTWLRPGFICAQTAEAWGIYQAMLFAKDCGFSKVQFESDNETLIKQLKNPKDDNRSYFGSIIDSILALKLSFRSCSFSHVKRGGNTVADCVAQLALTEPDKVWMEDVPFQAQSVYFADFIS